MTRISTASRRMPHADLCAPGPTQSTDLLVVVDGHGILKRLGARFPRAFGYTQTELLDRPFLAFVHPFDHATISAALNKIAQGEPAHGIESRFRCKDGSYRWLVWAAMPTPEGLVYAVARDISDRRPPEQAEAGSLRSERDAALAQRESYLAAVCHDVQQPLTVVLAQTQLLQRQLARGEPPPPEVLEMRLAHIFSAAARMRAMCQELAERSVEQSGHALELLLAPTDLVALVQQAVGEHEFLAGSRQFVFNSEVPTLEAAVDESRLYRVLANLLTNAIKYSPRGGPIHVTIKPDGPFAVVAVRDEGVGIPRDDLPHIFDRFHRGANVIGRFHGIGLGLASARQLVELHGGTISAESEDGRGSTFIVRLPLTSPEHAAQ
jgi:PAS domain S-box-containing protein